MKLQSGPRSEIRILISVLYFHEGLLIITSVGFCQPAVSEELAPTDIEREIQFGKLSSWWPTVLRTVDPNNGLTSCLSPALVSNHVILETALGTHSPTHKPSPGDNCISSPELSPAQAGPVMKSCQLDASIIPARPLIGRHGAAADQWERRRCQRRSGAQHRMDSSPG